MSKLIFKLYLILGISAIYSQTYEDALRYNQFYHEGSSRFNSMGGAFGALGGDLSSININPAGSSIFLKSELGFTLNFKNQEIKNDFNQFISNSKDNLYSYNHIGLVLVYDINKTKFSLGYNMNRLNDFNKSFSFSGSNNRGIDNYFLYYADGIPYNDLLVYEDETIQDAYKYLGDNFGFGDQQAFLGFQSYIINASNDLPGKYFSNAIYNNLDQSITAIRKGDHFKHSINFSGSFRENIYLGINLNFHEINYEEDKLFQESGYLNESPLKKVNFKEKLFAYGEGLSFQIGAIFKIKELRLGLSYTTPTLLKIEEENAQYIETNIIENDIINEYLIDPNVINFYEEYKLTLPSKSLFSIAYIFGDKGLISLDYELTKYSNSKFNDNNGNDTYMKSLNGIIKNRFNDISESIRIGGEYRIKDYSLRTGYYFYKGPDSAYENYRSGVSLGLGINYGFLNVDISVSKSKDFNKNQLYTNGLTNLYSIDNDLFTLFTTFRFKL